MFTYMKNRAPRPGRRKLRLEKTRRRIAQAAMELHEELGPARTSIKSIAERAGVQRLTVYRHFPQERALFAACTGLWAERNPPPDPVAWAHLKSPADRTQAALAAQYAYYRRVAPMLHASYRDRDSVPALAERMVSLEAWLDGLCEELLRGWSHQDNTSPTLRAALRHGLSFLTWESLAARELTDGAIAEMFIQWLAALAGCKRPAAAKGQNGRTGKKTGKGGRSRQHRGD
jgi:AcrR family transcriptional regulator